jgi:hypothetical protein
MKNKRGAQPGNNNAFKHGFYSAAFEAEEARLLDGSSIDDLTAEIELIRVMNMRFLESLRSSLEPLDRETQLSALRAVTLSAQAITGLTRLQNLRSSADERSDEIMRQLVSLPDDDPDDPDDPDPDDD